MLTQVKYRLDTFPNLNFHKKKLIPIDRLRKYFVLKRRIYIYIPSRLKFETFFVPLLSKEKKNRIKQWRREYSKLLRVRSE